MKHFNASISLALAAAALGCCAPAMAFSPDQMGVIVLNHTQQGALLLSGSAQAIVPQVRVDSAHIRSISGSGSAVLDSADVATVGGANFSGSSHCTSAVTTGAAIVSDPLLSLAAPPFNPNADLGTRSISGTTVTLQPGYYSGGITVSGGNVTLASGTYVLGGRGLTISNSAAHVEADGVLIYLRGSAALTLSGGASMNLTPPAAGPYAGIGVFQDRADSARATLSGGSGVQISGTIYVPAARLVISGSSQVVGEGPMIGNLVVANIIEVSGSGQIIIGGQSRLPTPGILFD